MEKKIKDSICLFSFSNFTFGFQTFYLKEFKIIYYDFFNWCTKENLVVNNKDHVVRDYQSDSYPLAI